MTRTRRLRKLRPKRNIGPDDLDMHAVAALVAGVWPDRGNAVLQTWDEVVTFYRQYTDLFACEPGRRPAVWWWCEQQRDPPDREAEAWLLDELGAMTEAEQQAVLADDLARPEWPAVDWPGWWFRRCWSWWKFKAPEQRNADEFESAQLVRLGCLNPTEQALLDNPAETLKRLPTTATRRFEFVFCYMSPDERRALGFVDSHEGTNDD